VTLQLEKIQLESTREKGTERGEMSQAASDSQSRKEVEKGFHIRRHF